MMNFIADFMEAHVHDLTIAMISVSLALALAVYMLPAIIAIARRHQDAPVIFLVNLFLGWTVLGWAVAFAWAAIK